MVPADKGLESDPRPMPAEFQYLLVVMALFAMLLLAGVPGQQLREAGERSTRTPGRQWVHRWSAQVQAEQASQAAPAPPSEPASPDR